MKRPRSPLSESLHIGIFPVVVFREHCGNHATVVECVPGVKNAVTSLLIRHTHFLKAGPIAQRTEILFHLSRLFERFAQNPYTFI